MTIHDCHGVCMTSSVLYSIEQWYLIISRNTWLGCTLGSDNTSLGFNTAVSLGLLAVVVC